MSESALLHPDQGHSSQCCSMGITFQLRTEHVQYIPSLESDHVPPLGCVCVRKSRQNKLAFSTEAVSLFAAICVLLNLPSIEPLGVYCSQVVAESEGIALLCQQCPFVAIPTA